MISNPDKKGAVKIEREGNRSTSSTANPYRRENVNVAQGPRMGNHGTPDKRRTFVDAKAERDPIANMIQDAYAARQHEYEDYEYTNGGSIHDNTKAKFKRSK